MSTQPSLDFETYIAPRPRPDTPEARRDVGKAVAASNNRWQLAKAQELALEYMSTHHDAIISDIRALAAERGIELSWHLNWTANVFLPAKGRACWFEPTGERRKTTHARGNARKVNVYRLTAEGRAAYRAAREAMG